MVEMNGNSVAPVRDELTEIPGANKRTGLADGHQEVILAVEDQEIQREFLQMILGDGGYRVILAADGIEAVRTYMQHKNEIGLVLLDMGLPGLGGEEVLSMIVASNPKAKVIAVSGSVEQQVRESLIQTGAADYLCKPYLMTELLLKVHHVLKGRIASAG